VEPGRTRGRVIDPRSRSHPARAAAGSIRHHRRWISDDLEIRRKLREMLWTEGMVVSTVVRQRGTEDKVQHVLTIAASR